MRIFDNLCAGQELMMQCLESLLWLVRHLIDRSLEAPEGARGKDRAHRHRSCIDLIEGEPVFDLALISLEDHMAISFK